MGNKKEETNLDGILKISKIGFYLLMTVALTVVVISFVRTMNVYKDIDIDEALDNIGAIISCEITYKTGEQYLTYKGLCVDREDVFEFMKNITIQNDKRN